MFLNSRGNQHHPVHYVLVQDITACMQSCLRSTLHYQNVIKDKKKLDVNAQSSTSFQTISVRLFQSTCIMSPPSLPKPLAPIGKATKSCNSQKVF